MGTVKKLVIPLVDLSNPSSDAGSVIILCAEGDKKRKEGIMTTVNSTGDKDKSVTLDQFLDKCLSPNNYTTQRQGQWCFNLLQQYRPDLAEKCRDSGVDPFYNDSRVTSFIYWVKLTWNMDLDTVVQVPISLSDLKQRYPL